MQRNWKETTHGGSIGHGFRRLVHMSMCLVPWVYYLYGDRIAHFFAFSLSQFVGMVVGVLTLFELLRLQRGWVFFGQRQHESHHLSSSYWSGLAMAAVLLFSPGVAYYVPLITVYAWVDPLLGELREKGVRSKVVLLMLGFVAAGLIWWLSVHFLGASWILGLVCAFLAVFFEQFNWRWIDDNALMQLVPLGFLVCHFMLF